MNRVPSGRHPARGHRGELRDPAPNGTDARHPSSREMRYGHAGLAGDRVIFSL
jgi:hypothetical protein